ncbi:F1F0 ATP synthase subunit e, mitochondrial [Marasmius sp. AFHP31]|uniref:ATP synthase F(0) complex subunit e, mitochondrial n=1 Tax=Marasmius tenuissimus TaxID=585030 RepID=A0ABR2Z837_9AGAR|nr:F1F0 ATP synthase subunit e, mitochondrial [Marasmius sp. AFHP31]
MVSQTLNVARYTALFTGVIYGFYHRRTLQSSHDAQKVQHAIHEREHLIAQAKEAWKNKQASKADDGVITDPEDPRFDLEKLLSKWENAA